MGGTALQQDKRNLSRLGLVHHWGGGVAVNDIFGKTEHAQTIHLVF